MIVNCKTCGKEFKVWPYLFKTGKGKFCSKVCYEKNRTSGEVIRKCKICGKEFTILLSQTKEGRGKFCSRSCWLKDRNRFTPPSRKGVKLPPFSKEHRDKLSKARIYTMAHNQKYCGTSIEVKMEQELTRRGIRFQKQYPIYQAKTIPDFFIAPNICIYCDGDYWHNLPRAQVRDSQQTFMLNFLGYKVYRFWEKDIKKDIGKCVDTIMFG